MLKEPGTTEYHTMRGRFYTRCCRLLILSLCAFVFLSYAGHHLVKLLSTSKYDFPQHARFVVNRVFADNGLSAESNEDDESIASSENGDPADGNDVWVECENICKGNTTDLCIPLDSAILVYAPKISSQDMNFRQHLHPKIRLKTEDNKPAMSNEYLDVMDCPVDVYFKQFTSLFSQNSCAVVGNGGVLQNSGCGAEIDAHDFIFRVNLKPIQNYTYDVGSKCDVMGINSQTQKDLYKYLTLAGPGIKEHEQFIKRLRYLNDSILWFPKSTKKMYVREEFKKIAHAIKEKNKLPIRMAYSWKAVSVERDWGLDGYATNGFNMFAVARTICKSISLYGFYPYQKDASGRHVPHHYFEEDVQFKYQTAEHDFVIEFNKLNELHEKGEVKLVAGKCRH